ncbi:MAG: ATP-binding cassette domain-containing protein [Gemmatimonadetes bacterium]|nr:ATP-binding cassette domain-containing protein [Gemmatimonadota bacterium]
MIEIRNLRKWLGGSAVLAGVDLTVREGETAVVIGGSGAGKSVLLKHIVGLLKPDEGEVWVDGERVADLDRQGLARLRGKIGYVFQGSALFDSMTVAENIAMGCIGPDGRPAVGRPAPEEIARCLRIVNLDPSVMHLMPAELSGGMRKRVGIARAVACPRRYLLYDEPTTGLDPMTADVINRLIVDLDDRLGVTSVVVTHDMKTAFAVGDWIALLHEGTIRWSGSAEEMSHAEDPIVRGFLEGRADLLAV